MKIVLLLSGKTTERHVAEGVDLYSIRIKKYIGFDQVILPEIKNTRNMPEAEQKNREGKQILKFIGKDDYLILLDDKGSELSTREFAGWLETRIGLPAKRLVFAVGGPWGFSEEVYGAASYKLSLSRLTFPHQLVRLIFTEQLYRAFTVIKGEPYHHD